MCFPIRTFMVDPWQPLSRMHEAHIQPLYALFPGAWKAIYPLRCYGTGINNPVEVCLCAIALSHVEHLVNTICAYALNALKFYNPRRRQHQRGKTQSLGYDNLIRNPYPSWLPQRKQHELRSYNSTWSGAFIVEAQSISYQHCLLRDYCNSWL